VAQRRTGGRAALPASLLIAVVPPGEHTDRGTDVFVSDVVAEVRTARRARGEESEPVDLQLGRGLRSRARPSPVSHAAAALPSTTVQFHVPIPGRDMMLLMTFSTPVPPGDLEDAFVELFDAIAAGARWIR
jgi:hypothetical protein